MFAKTTRSVPRCATWTGSEYAELEVCELLLMVLYPMVMLMSRLVTPVIAGSGREPWLSVWLVQVVSVALIQWWLMPTATSWCRRWLNPVDGAGLRNQPARRNSSRDKLRRVVDHLRDRRGAAVLELTARD